MATDSDKEPDGDGVAGLLRMMQSHKYLAWAVPIFLVIILLGIAAFAGKQIASLFAKSEPAAAPIQTQIMQVTPQIFMPPQAPAQTLPPSAAANLGPAPLTAQLASKPRRKSRKALAIGAPEVAQASAPPSNPVFPPPVISTPATQTAADCGPHVGVCVQGGHDNSFKDFTCTHPDGTTCLDIRNESHDTVTGTKIITLPTFTPSSAPASAPESSAPRIGDNNTLLNVPMPASMGGGNTIIGPTDTNGNAIYNKGGTAIGKDACADGTSVAIGAGAIAGACKHDAK